jgi:hypothetical protein
LNPINAVSGKLQELGLQGFGIRSSQTYGITTP